MGHWASLMDRYFVFGHFLNVLDNVLILKRPNHVKHLRIFSTIFNIRKNLPLKGIGHWALGIGHWALGTGHWALGNVLRTRNT